MAKGPTRYPYLWRGDVLRPRYERFTKADLADAYVDLYQQTHGEDTTDEEILTDLLVRLQRLSIGGPQ